MEEEEDVRHITGTILQSNTFFYILTNPITGLDIILYKKDSFLLFIYIFIYIH
jgi:hypothetical protein